MSECSKYFPTVDPSIRIRQCKWPSAMWKRNTPLWARGSSQTLPWQCWKGTFRGISIMHHICITVGYPSFIPIPVPAPFYPLFSVHKHSYSKPNRQYAIDADVRAIVRRNFTREYDFYYFCKQRLYKQYLALQLEQIIAWIKILRLREEHKWNPKLYQNCIYNKYVFILTKYPAVFLKCQMILALLHFNISIWFTLCDLLKVCVVVKQLKAFKLIPTDLTRALSSEF